MSTVAVINGSLRRDSIHRKLVESLAKLAGDRMTFHFVEIGDLPLYNDDLWPEPPTSVLRMKREVELADAVLFASPEYNRSFSPALKNAIDWGTRPYGKNSWRAKPATVVSEVKMTGFHISRMVTTAASDEEVSGCSNSSS